MTEKKKSRRTGHGAIYKYKYKSGGRTVTRWRWQLYVPVNPEDPDGEQERAGGSGFATAKEADDALQEARQKLRNQQSFGAGKVTLDRYINEWLDGLRLEASTIYGYRKIARNHVSPHLGKLQVDKITATRLRRHYTELLDHGRKDAGHEGEALAANTVNKVRVLIGAVLDAAVDEGIVAVNVARKTRTVNAPTGSEIRAKKPEVPTWEASELRRFLEWDKDVLNDDLFTLWLVFSRTGCRRSEALALRWSDVNPKNLRLSIRRAVDTINARQVKATKANGARSVDIDQGTADALKSWKAVRGSISLDLIRPGAYIFGNLRGEVRSPNEVGRRWRTRVKRAQEHYGGEDALKTITLKGLRHTHATLLLEAGVQPKVVQERLGHSNIQTTMNIYSHVTPTLQRDAVSRLEAIMDGA